MILAKEDLTITLIQSDILWKDCDNNLINYNRLLKQLSVKTDLIVLPEMFNTGFCMEPENLAEETDGKTITWMKEKASELNCGIAGSMIISEQQKFHNRLIYTDPYGNIQWYDKRHLFRMGNEESNFVAGKNRLIVKSGEWRVCFQICYDLRFPVWSRNQDDYDILVNCANWPAARDNVWQTLLKARAIENQCYVVGVNRTGTDGNGFEYEGNSMIVDPKGNVMKLLSGKDIKPYTITLSLTELNIFRKSFPAWKDRDIFTILS